MFTQISKNVKIKNQHRCISETDIVLYRSCSLDNVELWFLVDNPNRLYNDNAFLFNYIKVKYPHLKFAIVSSTVLKINENDKEFVKLYRNHKSNYKKLIPEKSKVVSIGRSIFALTESNDLLPEYFYDEISDMWKFYCPEIQSYVWPVDAIKKWKGLNNFLQIMFEFQINHAIKYKYRREMVIKPNLVMVENPNEFLLQNMDEKEVAWDTETFGLNFWNKLICITMSFDGITGYYLPWEKIDKDILNKFFENKYQILANGKFDVCFMRYRGINNAKVNFDTLNAGHIINETRSNSLKVHAWIYGCLGGYDNDLDLYKQKHKIKNYGDIPEEILFPYATMDAIVCFQVYKKMKEQIGYYDENSEIVLGTIDQKNPPFEEHWSLAQYFYDIVMPSIEVYTRIELQGLNINVDNLRNRSKEIDEDLIKLETQLCNAFNLPIDHIFEKYHFDDSSNNAFDEGLFDLPDRIQLDTKEFNMDSDVKLGKLLASLGWENLGTAKAGQYLTGKDQLLAWSKLGRKEADLILTYRKKAKLQSTYIGREQDKSGIWQFIKKHGENDYRVHSTYWVQLANSGRNRSSSPNAQNYPSRGEEARIVRSIFTTPNNDFVFLASDFSGYQLRLTAMKSKDPVMADVFINQGGDLHSVTTVEVLLNNKITLEEFLKVKKETFYARLRVKAKNFNFGLIFFAKSPTIMRTIIQPNWSEDECDAFIKDNNLELKNYCGKPNKYFTVAYYTRERFFDTYSVLREYLETQMLSAEARGYVRSCYGAFRRLLLLKYKGSFASTIYTNEYLKDQQSSYKGLIAHYKSIALNSPIQNREVVGIHRVMIALDNWLIENNMQSRLFLQCHDSLDLVVHRNELSRVCTKIKELAEQDYPEYDGIPVEIEGDVADPLKNELFDMGHDWSKYLEKEV